MTQKNTIKASQLFFMLYVCMMIMNITYNTALSSASETSDYIPAYLVGYILTFIMLIPVYFLYKKDKQTDILDKSIEYWGIFGKIAVIFYALYFLAVCIYNFAFYNNCISNIMTPKISLILVGISILLCSLYGAVKGIKGLAQTSGIIFIFFVAGALFLICAMLTSFKDYNFTPFFYNGYDTFSTEIQTLITHSPYIAVMGLLFSQTTGDIKKGIFFWNTGSYLTLILITAIMVGALGDFIKTQMYPFYTLSGIAKIGIFQRMDSIYIALWTSGLFLKISLFLYSFSLCIRKLFGEKVAKISLFVVSILICVISLIINYNINIYFFVQNSIIAMVITLICSTFIPLGLLVTIFAKRKKDEKN